VQQTKLRDNQQAIVSYIAGLMDSDGHISIGRFRYEKKGNWKYRPQIYFSNTDTKLIDIFTDFLDENNINFYIRRRVKPKKTYMDQYEVSINKMDHSLKFLNLIKDHLIGMKKEYSKLVINFINVRLNKKKEHKNKRNKLGRFTSGGNPLLGKEEYSLYQQYKKLREPQRLHAMPLPKSIGG